MTKYLSKKRREQEIAARPLADVRGADCAHCPLFKDRVGQPVGGRGPANPLLVIVGEAPGRNEIDQGMPFVGNCGDELEVLLGHARVSRTQVYIDNALACMPPGIDLDAYLKRIKREAAADGLEMHSPIDCCRPRLLRAMGVPRCEVCDKFTLGLPSDRCSCKEPRLVPWSHRVMAKVVVPMGNAALMSLAGVSGIMKRRGAPMEV